jgi:transposase-like protein
LSNWKDEAVKLALTGMSWRKVAIAIDKPRSTVSDYLRKVFDVQTSGSYEAPKDLPKVLLLDIETAPIAGAVWSLWKQNVGLNQIINDWFILSYSAKWLGASPEEIMYEDLRGIVAEEDDSHLLRSLWKLLDEADILITQNGKSFDSKKINARLVLNGFQPPSSYKHIDTLLIAKSIFSFTSNKLEYMTDKLCTKYKKLTHGKFHGFYLWKECLADNLEAWEEMEKYNKYDVLSLEELYYKIAAWDKRHPNFNLYSDSLETKCRCGSTDLVRDGYHYTQLSKFQRYKCTNCGAESRDRTNLLSKEKRETIQMNTA